MENSAPSAYIEGQNESTLKIYEIGYHIVPTVAEEHLPAEVGAIKDVVESNGGIFISEEFPKLRPLAYSIPKTIEGRKQDFDQAYFGWVKFEVSPETIDGIKKSLDGNPHVLRYLLIETVRESTMSYIKPAFKKDEDGKETAEVPQEITKEDEEKISKSIDELVAE